MNVQKYCSIDLEFTGFNPQVDQILEIGFVFFELTEAGIQQGERWSQIFRPSVPVHDKILGLTGLTLAELEQAPSFNDEHRQFLQEKLGEARLVAHNPALDVRFLESYGLTLSGHYIDTLELAQIILPTHHSYNLENLMNYFQITPEDSHRALSDAVSTTELLNKLLEVYYQFPDELKEKFVALAVQGQFEWQEMIKLADFPKAAPQTVPSPLATKSAQQENLDNLEVLPGAVISYGNYEDLEQSLAQSFLKLANANHSRKVMVLPSREAVLKLWQAGYGTALFSEEELFSQDNFEKFLEAADSQDEFRFALKVLVWLHTNWQTTSIADLNLSFFGGQFKSFVSGGAIPVEADDSLLLCAYADVAKGNHKALLADRWALFVSMAGFEQYLSSGNTRKASWNMALYLLRSVYNPESEFGRADLKNEVLDAIASVDLFFSLVYILLQRHFPGERYVTLQQILEDDYLYRRLTNMTYTLTQKLQKVNEETSLPALKFFIEQMNEVLVDEPGIIKWIEVSEYNTTFKNQPLDIASDVKKFLKDFQAVSFAERYSDPDWLNYLSKRLGLELLSQSAQNYKPLPCALTLLPSSSSTVTTYLEVMTETNNLPAILIFADPKSVKSFYDNHYTELNSVANVLAQGYSGGPNKLFRNFAIKQNSILLVSSELVLRQTKQIPVKSGLVLALPKYDYTHPYNAAVIKSFSEIVPDLNNTLQMGKILEILNKLASSELTKLVITYRESEQSVVNRLVALN